MVALWHLIIVLHSVVFVYIFAAPLFELNDLTCTLVVCWLFG